MSSNPGSPTMRNWATRERETIESHDRKRKGECAEIEANQRFMYDKNYPVLSKYFGYDFRHMPCIVGAGLSAVMLLCAAGRYKRIR